ncbi:maleylpyruvate isomerase N-terminal domain-containing protein [Pedococcus soli]
MHTPLELPDLLRLIDERSVAFRAAIAAAPDLDAQVPTCPDWTLRDLARHIGMGRFTWGATVASGPEATAKATPEGVPEMPQDRDELVAWLEAAAQALLDALSEVDAERRCWVPWTDSQSPATCGAVARHQVQEIAIHTHDAQLTAGVPEPLPEDVAVDGVEEFLVTCVATTFAWPHEPAVLDYVVDEGAAWRIRLNADGAQVTRLPDDGSSPSDDAVPAGTRHLVGRSTASDLVFSFYARVPLDRLRLEGDTLVLDQLVDWDPGA